MVCTVVQRRMKKAGILQLLLKCLNPKQQYTTDIKAQLKSKLFLQFPREHSSNSKKKKNTAIQNNKPV